jgi:hypothetical protein
MEEFRKFVNVKLRNGSGMGLISAHDPAPNREYLLNPVPRGCLKPTRNSSHNSKTPERGLSRVSGSDMKLEVSILRPSRPGELHPEPLTDPDMTLSRHPARAVLERLSPFIQAEGFPPVAG